MTDFIDDGAGLNGADDIAYAYAAGSGHPDEDARFQPQPRSRRRMSARERIGALTREKHELRRQLEDAWATLDAIEQGLEVPQDFDADYAAAYDEDDDNDYGEAPYGPEDAWAAEGGREADDAEAQAWMAEANQQIFEAYAERRNAAIAELPGFAEIVEEGARRDAWSCSEVMNEVIMTSELGPQVAYFLATNPSLSHQIAELDPLSQLRALGRVEGRLARSQPKTITDAPNPPGFTARGGGGRFEVSPDTNDFAAFERSYGLR